MRNQVFKKLFSVLLALIMVAGLLPASVLAEGEGNADSTPAPTEAVQPTESAEPTKPAETETPEEPAVTPEATEAPEPMPENPAATVESTQGEPTEEITIAPVNEVAAQANVVTTVIACSDFQYPGTNGQGDDEGGAQIVKNILNVIKNNEITNADGFICAGDYSYGYSKNADTLKTHLDYLKNAVESIYGSDLNEVYVQGNHDQVNQGTGGLSGSGNHDNGTKYGVFVIDEDDYMWHNKDEARIKQTAANLKTYLDEKITNKFSAPIFVVSHLPLHYSMRTYYDGDGKYANYIFDVLNEAGAAGLNIIFLYGHDHSNGWDDYLGGAAVYLAKGDQINIAQASKTEFNVETLNFTYMNAGFTGYYENHNGADDKLTMTVFHIEDNKVTVQRFDANGEHNLKSRGVTNSYKNEDGYAPNTTVYECPQTITLATVTPPETVTVGNVSVTAPGLTDLAVSKVAQPEYDKTKYSAYASYDITPEGYTQGYNATVTITLDEADGFDASRKVTVIDQTGTNPDTTVSIVNGTVTFTTTHFSTYDIAQAAPAEPTERTYTRVTSLDELVSGSQYLLIVNEGTDYFMLPESVSKESGTRVGFNIEATTAAGGNTITGDYSAKEWKLTASGSEWILSAASGDAYFANADGTRAQAVFSTTNNTKYTIAGSADNFTFKSGKYAFDHSSAGVINGYNKTPSTMFYIYRLTSTGTVDPSGGDWVTISDGQGKTIFRLASSLTSGKKYLIVSSNQAGKANAVNLNGDSINSASVTIIADSKGNYIEAPANTAQWTYTRDSKFQNVSSTGTYLRGSKDSDLRTTTDTSDSYTTWNFVDQYGLYTTKDSKNYYISSSFKMLKNGSLSNRVYIYEEATLQTTAEYAKITGSLEYTVAPGTSAEDALAAVKDGIDVVTSPDKTNVTTLQDDDKNIVWTLDPSYDGTPGEYAVTISYKNKVLGTAKVIVPALTVTKIEVAPMEGSVQKGASNYAKTGSKLTVTYSNGSTRTVDVTLGMLSGDFNKNVVGDYTGLTITYEGKTVQNYTLHVTPKTGNNYPEYPHEGAVRVGKTGEGINFQSSGIAKVELTATGVPVKKGADVIVMVDTSSSMNNIVDGQQRIDVLRQSLMRMMDTFQETNADGTEQDIRVAIADFNGYVTSGDDNTPYRLKSVDHLKNATTRSGSNTAQVYTGSTQLNAGAFVTAGDAASVISSIETHSGTNYDYAFDAVYQLGQAILKQNAQNGDERDLFVIFMSDGAPFQYNYFSSQSDAANWNNWLQGTVTDNMWDSNAHNYFYNGSGNKHRMAEAIKGDPNTMYTVIRKDSTDNYGGQQYMTQLPGLGATMYSIGFCLEQDQKITVSSMEHVLKNISSDSEKFYYKVNSANELTSAFTAIGNEIAYAATNARFVDTMGANYDLQMKPSTYTLSDSTTQRTITPEIIVQAYDIYTKADDVAESEIGKRKGTSTVLETVTFNENGTEAYSDKKSGNILIDGVICANTFWYNTTGNTVSIDTNGDGTNDYNLAPETFYWKMGTINQTELALSYYVYLTGSMEGTRAEGSYPTNESATLHYTNWLGNEAKKDTVSPVMPWESANVSYAFYLVDGEGKPVTNQTTGATGSFANAVKVTQPVVYSEVLLNSGAEVKANIVAQKALPAGYELYDAAAAYTVSVSSGDGTGSWTITKGNSAAATTYVAQYDPNNSAAVSNALLSTEVNGGQNDYTHTVVWFAVKYQISCVPDAVVIDFGLPVDISVLANDILGEGAAVMGLAAVGSIPAAQGTAELARGFSPNGYTGTYGTATINGTKVRYTPGSMKMDNTEKFAYAAQANLENDQKYYYSTVTVIPAANIYYEDSFVKFVNAENATETAGIWENIGQTKDGITQQEDRPGKFSLSAYDANNVYGFDSAYTACTEYSLGSARKVTVTSDMAKDGVVWPTAQFTFKGTGFDIISLTDNTSGAIFVDVYNVKTSNKEKSVFVDNYYGYTYNSETNTWDATPEKANALYQIPVIALRNLPYAEYNVVIKVAYSEYFDHTAEPQGSYSFWLDAVRVYDPAGTDLDNEYVKDKEGFPQYIKLRDAVANKDAALDGKKALFIDGGNTADIATYANIGPNNEVYLANGQAITFKLNVGNANIETIQIGAKAPMSEGTAKLNVNNAEVVENGLSTATEMYYNIKDKMGANNTFTISNTGSGILSLTNLKITFNAKGSVSLGAMNAEEQTASVMAVRALFAPAPVEPEPEPEPEKTFEPDRFEASWSRNVMQGRKATLTVKTSEDVEAITVDGQTIRSYRTRTERVGFGRRAKRITYREFTYSMVAQESADFSVTAINAEGTESEAITARLTVKTRPNSMRDMWDWFKGWF